MMVGGDGVVPSVPAAPPQSSGAGILERQNTAHALELQRAKSALYASARTFARLQALPTVVVPVVAFALARTFPTATAPVAIGGGILGLIGVMVIRDWQRDRRTAAARVQEVFDCFVLSLPWQAIAVGPPPSPETVVAWSERRRSVDGLIDWYPRAAGDRPLETGRLVCQRANGWWDARMRRRYATLVGSMLLVGLVALVATAVAMGMSATAMLTTAASLQPLTLWSVQQWKDNAEAATARDRVREVADDLLARASTMTADALTTASRQLQDQIYRQRVNEPLLPQWAYAWWRTSDERDMVAGAACVVDGVGVGLLLPPTAPPP
jgi:SMODS-associating 4TM effector domain